MTKCTLANISMTFVTAMVRCTILMLKIFDLVISIKTINMDLVKLNCSAGWNVKENGTQAHVMDRSSFLFLICSNRLEFTTLTVLMELFTNSCQMARFTSKNGIMVKRCMKKNFRKIQEIHMRPTSSLSHLTKNKKSKKRHKKHFRLQD